MSEPVAPAPAPCWLRVQHDTVYDYDSPVELAHHLACLSPRNTAHQQVRDWTLSIDPPPDGWSGAAFDGSQVGGCALSHDSWGNARLAFSHARVHERLVVGSRFEVGLNAPPPIEPARSPAWETVAEALRYQAGAVRTEAVEFTLASHFAPRDAALAAFARQAFTPGRPLAEAALALMRQIHAQFRYAPASTDV
ncbi:MAG: transglutaminase N-terminal domain-containing protein, partial [Burkholderiaceae bacterium]